MGRTDDLTADLPAPLPDGLPSDIVATRNAVLYISYRKRVGKAVSCLLLLLAGLAGGVLPDTAWMVAAAVLMALVIPSLREVPEVASCLGAVPGDQFVEDCRELMQPA